MARKHRRNPKQWWEYVKASPNSQIIEFGRHKGNRFDQIPEDYLFWMCRNATPQYQQAEQELERRSKTTKAKKEDETMAAKTKLYEFEIDGKKKFGHILAQTSGGTAVVEILGGGGVIDLEPSKLTEVLPYTVAVSDPSGRISHVKVKPDTVEKGQMLLMIDDAGWTFGIVQELNTRNRNPVKFVSIKLMGGVVDVEMPADDLIDG